MLKIRKLIDNLIEYVILILRYKKFVIFIKNFMIMLYY